MDAPVKTNLILPIGTRIVTRVELDRAGAHDVLPPGAVGVVERAPTDGAHGYRVRFPDGEIRTLRRGQLLIYREFQRSDLEGAEAALRDRELLDHVVYRCVTGSRAYGLDTEGSDVDRRGIYLAPAELEWSLYGVPGQIEGDGGDEVYWELGKFLRLALKANPNILECLFSPLVEEAAPVAEELLAMRGAFLSKVAYQTFNGYALGQFKKLEQDLRSRGEVRWKHAMHLVRLLLTGIHLMETGELRVSVGEERERLLEIRRGEVPWEDVDAWRLELHARFDEAYATCDLPERPDHARVNDFLIRARRATVDPKSPGSSLPGQGRTRAEAGLPGQARGGAEVAPGAEEMVDAAEVVEREAAREPLEPGAPKRYEPHPALGPIADAAPYPLLFASVSGAHLYGFPSPDSDWDLRGVHVLPAREVLGLERGPDTLEVMEDRDGLELDLVTHDVEKFFGLLLRRNGLVLEQIVSPLVVRTSEVHDELRDLVADCVTRHHVHHYRGLARSRLAAFEKAEGNPVKPLLYAYRALLCGIHLMRTGEVQPNLAVLNEYRGRRTGLEELIERKRGGAERGLLPEREVPGHREALRLLQDELEEAARVSILPAAPSARPRLYDLLIRVRQSVPSCVANS